MSQTPLKLTMIGPSGTGKSCYLYATYFRMLEGVAGFNFNCVDFNPARELEDAWNAILDDGVWPAGSVEGEEYRFACKHNGKQVGEFAWLDYRGGILNEDASEGSDLTNFLNRAVDSDAILVCLPTDVLLTAQANDLRVQRRWSRMKNEILRILGEVYRRNDAASLIFMITKSDLCKSQEEGRLCVETIRTAFQQYFVGTPEYAMITATRLGRFEGESDDFQQGAEIKGVLDPHNVHLPILLPFLARARAAKELRSKLQKEAGRLARKPFKNSVLGTVIGACVGAGVALIMGIIAGRLEVAGVAAAVMAFIFGVSGLTLSDLCNWDSGTKKEEVKGKIKELNEFLNVPTDAIWRELAGRVELYYQGKRVLSADGKARKA